MPLAKQDTLDGFVDVIVVIRNLLLPLNYALEILNLVDALEAKCF